MAEPSILILGAGTFGTSTAYHLAHEYADPSRITVIDRWSRADSLRDKTAAAIDVNRIIRTDYASHMYCDLANEAIHPWFWSIAVQGHFRKTGWIVLEDGDGRFGEGVRRTFRERGGDYTRDVSVSDLSDYEEVLKGVDASMKGYFNPEAGWCDAESATTSFMKVAIEKGVKREVGEIAELLLSKEKGRVEGCKLKDGRIFKADKVILATGAWTSSLLSPLEDALVVPDPDRIERQITAVGRLSAYYTLSERETQSITDTKMPIVVIPGNIDVIPPSLQNRTLKVNDLKTEVVNTVKTPSGRTISVPSTRHQTDIPLRLQHQSGEVIANALPYFTSRRTPSRWRICYDAVTPTEDFLLCRHPNSSLSNLYIVTGGSFHSYKFLPVAGKYVSKVLRGESCGEEKDKAWRWKNNKELARKGGREFGDGKMGDQKKKRIFFTENDKARL